MSFDEMLFYGGLGMSGIFIFSGVILALILKIQHIRLDMKLDEEYGKEKERESKRCAQR